MSRFIENIVYINLESRTDRKEQIEGQLTEYGLPFERFNAIVAQPGCVGCSLSHLQVLKEAKQKGYANILILEDDFMFVVHAPQLETALEEFFSLDIPYHVCMLSYKLSASEHIPNSDLVGRVLEAQTASGYLVHSSYYDTLIQVWEEAVVSLQRTGEHWKYACDQIWKTVQPGASWYAFSTRIGTQRPSFADTGSAPVWTAYTNC
jgi:GR25 family glycosyltransferase involved in LPS biosynthesis